MKRNVAATLIVGMCLAAGSALMFGQTAPAAQAPAASGPINAEVTRILDDAGNKMIRLAEAFPPEKYTWRPMEGVRSVSEVFLHVAGGNIGIARAAGAQPPADFVAQGFDRSTTEKAKVVDWLRRSLDLARQAVQNVSDEDMNKSGNLFGRPATWREILFYRSSHAHEHLGQAIAYARMNQIVPPWTEEAQQRQQQQPAKRP